MYSFSLANIQVNYWDKNSEALVMLLLKRQVNMAMLYKLTDHLPQPAITLLNQERIKIFSKLKAHFINYLQYV